MQFPLTYHQKMTPRRLKFLTASAWLLGTAEAVSEMLFLFVSTCKDWQGVYNYNEYLALGHFAAILLLNGTLYGKIWVIAYRQRNKLMPIQSIHIKKQNKSAAANGGSKAWYKTVKIDKATKVVFVVIVLFFIQWIPYLICDILVKMGPILMTLGVVALTNSLVNNLVFFLMNKQFKNAYKKSMFCVH